MANLMESIFSAFRPKKGKEVLFVDIEAGVHDKRIHDIGALRADGTIFRSPNRKSRPTGAVPNLWEMQQS